MLTKKKKNYENKKKENILKIKRKETFWKKLKNFENNEKVWKNWKSLKKLKKFEKIEKVWKNWKSLKKLKKFEKIWKNENNKMKTIAKNKKLWTSVTLVNVKKKYEFIVILDKMNPIFLKNINANCANKTADFCHDLWVTNLTPQCLKHIRGKTQFGPGRRKINHPKWANPNLK